MSTLLSILRTNCREHGDRVFAYFIKDGETTVISFERLLRESLRYARRFTELGIGRGDNVLIVLEHCPDLVYAFVGALLNGSIPALMPFPSIKQDRQIYWHTLEELFARIKTRAIITYAANRPHIMKVVADLHVLTPEELPAAGAGPLDFDFPDVSPDDIAFLQHTSGTTGLKKSIALSHRAVVNQIETYARVLRLTPADVVVSWLPLYHDMGLIACFILPLLRGIPVAWMDPFEWVYQPEMLFQTIDVHRGTLVWLPNFAFHHLALNVNPAAHYDLSSLRAVIDCSEPCKPRSFREFCAAFAGLGIRPELLQTCYAMAENVFAVTQSTLGMPVRTLTIDRTAYHRDRRAVCQPDPQQALELLSVGAPVPGVDIQIVDGGRRQLPDPAIGEVAISGCSLFSGYYQLPDVTRASLENGWYYTGDLGFVSAGELFICGRMKDVIIVNGKNYYAHDVEMIVNELAGVKKGRVVAVGVHNDRLGSEEIVVIAETLTQGPAEQRALKKQAKSLLMAALDLYVRDVHLVPPGWIVKTTSGKMSRADNLRKYLAESERPAGQHPGETKTAA